VQHDAVVIDCGFFAYLGFCHRRAVFIVIGDCKKNINFLHSPARSCEVSPENDSLPKVFSCSPLTLALSRKRRGEFKERTFGNRYT
jgi:hypothetical protein